MTDTPSVAQQVVAAIRAAGIDTLFCLPGVQNDDFFDVLVDAPDIRPIVSRQEQGAAYMANGASLVSGTPSAFCVVPGPGMLNAGGALTSGYWSNARVLAIVGEIPTGARGRAFGVLHELADQHIVFEQHVGGMIAHLTKQRSAPTVIRAYGEMVDVLWKRGRTDAAMSLEMLWNRLAATHHFALLCGYSMGNFYKRIDQFQQVCAQHSHVLETDSKVVPFELKSAVR